MSLGCRTAAASAARRFGAACAGLQAWPTALVCGAGVQACLLVATLSAGAPPLRVCSDPNNMPFSNVKRQGFENKIAELVARDLGRPLAYFWSPQRRGFVRNTLAAGQCDVMMGVPVQYDRVQSTRAYYRSSYAFVARRDRHLRVASFDDVRLKTLKIGIQITGDDYNNPPAAQALAARHLGNNVRGYTVYGDYSKPDPQRDVVDAVADGRVDIAVVWGPFAGYYGRREPAPMDVVPVSAERDGPGVAFAFDIAMGVRRGDRTLRDALDAVIVRRHAEIRRILTSYGVPLL
ncbi:MAG: putative methanol oxidation protein [Acidobacteria bacterium]|nr:putative methanol oxidation protein [Acidobacteriota bacterium]